MRLRPHTKEPPPTLPCTAICPARRANAPLLHANIGLATSNSKGQEIQGSAWRSVLLGLLATFWDDWLYLRSHCASIPGQPEVGEVYYEKL